MQIKSSSAGLSQPLAQHRRPSDVRRAPMYYRPKRRVLSSVSCEISFDTEGSGVQREITQIQPRLFSSRLSALTQDPEEGDQRSLISIRRATTTGDEAKQKWSDVSDSDDFLPALQYDVELDDNSLADIRDEFVSAEPVGCVLRHFSSRTSLLLAWTELRKMRKA